MTEPPMPMSEPGLGVVAQRLRRALRQEQRLQSAHTAVVEEQARINHTSGWLPPSLQALEDQLSDEGYFLIVAARQAVSARQVLVAMGHQAPKIRHEAGIIAWRDVLEHWDDPTTKGIPIRALIPLASFTEQVAPGTSHLYSEDGLLYLGGVSLAGLRRDLGAVLRSVEEVIEERFEHDWLDEERAAEFIGLPAVPDSSPCFGLGFMTFPEKGKRYQRAQLSNWLLCMERVRAAEDEPL